MNLDMKLAVLERIYAIYEAAMGDLEFACQKHCAHCCTRNVTMTTLEGYYLLNALDPSSRARLMAGIRQEENRNRFQPKATINQLADLCAKGQDPPEEENDAKWGACPVLEDDLCPAYIRRPFGCRCMVSLQNCGSTGYADMPEWVVSVNNVFMQYIEQIDVTGFSGNFSDILLFLDNPENQVAYARDHQIQCPSRLLPNQPLYVLMVPPEDRARIEPLLRAIRSIRVDSPPA